MSDGWIGALEEEGRACKFLEGSGEGVWKLGWVSQSSSSVSTESGRW